MDDVKRKRGRPSKKVKLFNEKITTEDILKVLNSEREIVKDLKKVEKLILNITLVLKEKKDGKIEGNYEIEIEEFKFKNKLPPKKKIFNLSELIPEKFPLMEASIGDVKLVHFSCHFDLREHMLDPQLEEITGTNIITRDYTRVETNNYLKYFN